MNILNHLIPCFPNSTRLNAPDWYLNLKQDDSYNICVRLSDMDKLRDTEGLPKSFRLFVIIDTHFGKVKPPKSIWWAITPYGIYRMKTKENEPEGFKPVSSTKKGTNCTECHMNMWPCERHLIDI
jgi:hypothetical protein